MKLNASKRKCFVLHCHDNSITSNGHGLQLFWQPFDSTVQGVIPGNLGGKMNERVTLLVVVVVLSRDEGMCVTSRTTHTHVYTTHGMANHLQYTSERTSKASGIKLKIPRLCMSRFRTRTSDFLPC